MEPGVPRIWSTCLASMVVAVLLLIFPAVVLGQPMPPHLSKLLVSVDGKPAPDGTVVTVWMEGLQVALVTTSGGKAIIRFDGSPNQTISFKIGGVDASEKDTWEVGGHIDKAFAISITSTPVPTSPPAPTSPPPPTSSPAPTSTLPPTSPPAPTSPPVQPTMHPKEPGFRENPTTRLRPVNDQISADQDGIIEIFMFNPSVNDVPLTVDMMITVPAGIHVYGEGFSCSGTGAGACSGSFTIVPGQSKAGHLNVKSEKIGQHQVHFTGYWWPGNNKDLRQPISLTHPFNVTEPSKGISQLPAAAPTAAPAPTAVPPSPQSGGCGESTGGGIPLGAMILFLGVGILAARKKF